ncbi:hypothetical protein [Nocardioides sp. zg-1228]|uniref:hypothetical protein n=1 Tax=Nocardioides sp. zg-1228 TaxID=2763008 RepID=UPI001642AD20|nr:hypothetical protein [Nocardioides sp. zg-1228]MBC2932948.1 hypothetical protein [Nocardioides sp. zg-1228]QSF56850.1 hypothetical protein JX575_14785 [Nocardioides sp. zg-1228]
MVDLFRFIEHDFASPARTDAIDVTNDSDFQQALTAATEDDPNGDQTPGERVRALARDYLDEHYPSPTSEPASLGDPLTELRGALRSTQTIDPANTRRAVSDLFGVRAQDVVARDDFQRDRELLQNAALAVKLLTAFDRVDAARIAGQVRAVAFLELIATDAAVPADRTEMRRLLSRPLRIPPAPLAATARTPVRRQPPPPRDTDQPGHDGDREALRGERDALAGALEALVTLRPDELRVTVADAVDAGLEARTDRPDGETATESAGFGTSTVRLNDGGRRRFSDAQLTAMSDLGIEPDQAPLPFLVDRVTRRLVTLNDQLLPQEVTTAAPVFRVGGRLFAGGPKTTLSGEAPDEPPADEPDVSIAITRPVGIGNLRVVRQELIGYSPGAISHIENVLEGELLRRRTRRHEFMETFETLETTTSESRERDQQSTEHHELASEVQKESGRQSSTAGDGTTSSDYGKLVENSKSTYAQTLVNKSVETITQEVHATRGRREGRSYTERAQHVLDNSQGTEKIRGIYQWVDKEYSLRVLDYGKRLMYDVVVPEPAAVLVQALQSAVAPEAFQLSKPVNSIPAPSGIDAANYQWYAQQYGVSGSVNPPPDLLRTVAHTEVVDGSHKVNAYGGEREMPHQTAFKLAIPGDYQALSGYVQRVNATWLQEPGRMLEVFVGSSNYHRLGGAGNPGLNVTFTMAGETGEIPVTARCFDQLVLLAYSVALVCQRTDASYAQWQLRTHAALVSGYQRQLADYEDKLTRYVAGFRAQIAAGGLSHDPKVALEELKRAFVFLLLGEHPAAWLPTPAPAPAPPAAALPDPLQVREWGAVIAFFERAFEWENLMYTCYPYFWARPQRWQELALMQDADPMFEAFLKAGAARVVVPVRPGFEAALAHYQETGDVWMGQEMPDMFGDHYLSIIDEIKAANFAPGQEVCVQQWKVTLPTTLVLLKEDADLPHWDPTPCGPGPAVPPEP